MCHQDPTQTAAAHQQRTRIFLAEDDKEMRGLVASVLRRSGHEVVEAADGLELLRQIESVDELESEACRDLVVTDVRMPGATGLEVLASLRQSRPNVPVVLVSSFGDEELRADARQLGAAAFLDKPFSLAALQTTILQLSAWPANNNGAT